MTTGASESTNLQNIYDMAGNVLEWTIETSEKNQERCVYRGGSFDGISNNIPVSLRYYFSNDHLYYIVLVSVLQFIDKILNYKPPKKEGFPNIPQMAEKSFEVIFIG